MKSENLLIKGRQILAQRNFSFLVVILVLLSNIGLAWKVLGERDRIILIPQNDLTKQIIFDGKKIPDTYLVDWAASVLADLMTVNSYTVERKNKLFLEISSTSGGLKDVIKANARRIKQDGMSTVFYPKGFEIDRAEKKILVDGTFMAYFGRDKNPIVSEKTYALGWRETAHGCVLVESLEEVRNDDF